MEFDAGVILKHIDLQNAVWQLALDVFLSFPEGRLCAPQKEPLTVILFETFSHKWQ